MKGILEFLTKNNRWAIALIIIIFIIGGSIYKLQRNKIDKLNDRYESEVKLKNALTANLNVYKDKEDNWVSEKLTIQARIDNLLEDSARLTASQQDLIEKVNIANAKNTVITAAVIRYQAIIDSLMHDGGVVVDTTNKTVKFIEENNPDLKYKFKAFNVLPYPPDIQPTLLIEKLELPNEQFIKFQWDDNKREDYPISFSITNTNKYIKVYDVNSYAIPALQKPDIVPTNWEKFTDWMNRNQKYFKWFGGGTLVGGAAGYIIFK